MRRLSLVLVAGAIVWFAIPANAIVNGQADGGKHPYVGEIMQFAADFVDPAFDDPGAWFVCTGTLVSATVVITAGHCTFGVGLDGESTTAGGRDGSGGNDIWIDFSEAAHVAGFPASEDYERSENREAYQDRRDFLNDSAFWIRGTAFAHPQFASGPFILHDLGVVVLDTPVTTVGFGEISPEGHLTEAYAHTPRNHVFELVGYGLEESRPFFSAGGHTRQKAQIKLNSLNPGAQDAFAFFSNNNGAAHQGGACQGDSGGPIFDSTDSNMVVAVQSFSLGPRATCSGIAGGYRVDGEDDLTFLAEFGIAPAD